MSLKIISAVILNHRSELEIPDISVGQHDIKDSVKNLLEGSDAVENISERNDDLCFLDAVENGLAEEYISYAAFEEAFKTYQLATMQTFVVGRSEKIPQSHALCGMLVYKKVKFGCVYHQSYK